MTRDIVTSFDVRGTDVLDDVADKIDRGIRRSSEDIGDRMRRSAQQKIEQEGRIWKGELINSFDTSETMTPSRAVIRLSNDAAYARAVDEGAEYGSEGPPLHRLIPWVLTNMQHVRVNDDGDLEAR